MKTKSKYQKIVEQFHQIGPIKKAKTLMEDADIAGMETVVNHLQAKAKNDEWTSADDYFGVIHAS